MEEQNIVYMYIAVKDKEDSWKRVSKQNEII